MIYITNMVFICQFFNTGILPMLCTANLEDQIPARIVNALGMKGDNTDFNQNWYTNIGDTIASAMMFNIYFPVCMEICWLSYRWTFRLLDMRGTTQENPSNSVTIQQYINKWAGPQFFIHYKYSAILNITFITMCFGISMPILFPVAAASLFVLYCLEVFMLFYVYKRPPAYDVALNNHVLLKLAWAPFYMLAFAFWQLSSPQLIGSYQYMIPLGQKQSPFLNQHLWYKSMRNSGPAQVLLYLAVGYLFYLQFKNLIKAIFGLLTNDGRKCCPKLIRKYWVDQVEIDEDIPDYDEVLTKSDRKYTLAEELNSRMFGVQTMLQESYDKLVQMEEAKKFKRLTGIHTYDILRNPAYVSQFQYFSADLPDRDAFIIDDDTNEDNNNTQSDLVRIVLSLAYIRPHMIEQMGLSADEIMKMARNPKATQ
jgi:hypothetical protein